MQQEILDTLFGDRDVLTDLIIDLAPKTPAEKQLLQGLVARRDRLSMTIQDVINSDITTSTSGLDSAMNQLNDATASLDALKHDFDGVANAISIVDQIVKLVTSLLAPAST